MKANIFLRREMRMRDVPFWALAIEWGCTETTAIKRFRTEFSDEEREKVMLLIQRAAQKRGG